jgi:carboxyl-terminal processing protease
MLVVGILIGLSLPLGLELLRLPRAEAQQGDEAYQPTLLFTRVLEQVRQDYYDESKVGYKNLIYAALKGMLSSLDPHTQFLDEEAFREMQQDTKGEFSGLGIVIDSKDGFLTIMATLEGTPSFRAGLLPGDRILKINEKNTDRLSRADAMKLLRGQRGEKVTLGIFRPPDVLGGRTNIPTMFEVELIRETIKVSTVKDAKLLPPEIAGDERIGYIRLEQFGENTATELDRALSTLEQSGLQGMVLDLRNNPGGLLDSAVEVSGRFLPPGQLVVSTQGRNPDSRREYRAKLLKQSGNYVMAVLINGYSASGAEIVAGALQDLHRAVIVGETSFGKGSVQSVLDLGNGVGMRLTTARYYTPNNRIIHEVGVVPDVVVPVSEDDERNLLKLRSPLTRQLAPEEKEQLKDFHDVCLERAVVALRGLLIYGDRNHAAKAAL